MVISRSPVHYLTYILAQGGIIAAYSRTSSANTKQRRCSHPSCSKMTMINRINRLASWEVSIGQAKLRYDYNWSKSVETDQTTNIPTQNCALVVPHRAAWEISCQAAMQIEWCMEGVSIIFESELLDSGPACRDPLQLHSFHDRDSLCMSSFLEKRTKLGVFRNIMSISVQLPDFLKSQAHRPPYQIIHSCHSQISGTVTG